MPSTDLGWSGLKPATGVSALEMKRRPEPPSPAKARFTLHPCWLLIAVLTAGSAIAAAQALPAGYVGSETCQVCHEDIFKAFAKNPHHSVEQDKRRGFQTRACESCHGPGEKHAESADATLIRNPLKLAAAEADKMCLGCHLNQPTHIGRLQSSHAKDQVACTSCHKMHDSRPEAPEGPKGLVARNPSDVNQLCAGCHSNVWAQFQRPNHHKLPEGAMSCVDCHNPHGSVRTAMAQSFAANEPGCLNCHGDKRGPFTFEHAPVRFEGCASCHEPHGSANPRMLVRHEVRIQCLECHASLPTVKTSVAGVVPPAFHDLRSPRYQNCTVCHQKIHGSYVDRNLLR
jgi:DmsE family decaheme c-type cytochrome